MEVINRAFISRPYIPEGDSYGEVKDTLERLPFMIAVGTRYVPPTNMMADPCIVASSQMVDRSIQMPFACEHNHNHNHLRAAVALVKTEFPDSWQSLAVLGSFEHGCGFLFCFGEDGLNT